MVAVDFALLTTAWTLTSKEKQPEASDALKRRRLKVALSDAKDFSIWLLLTWPEYVTFFLIYVFSIIFVLAGPLRQLVYAVSLKSRMWARDYSTFFSGILFMFYVQLAVAIPTIAYTYFGKDRLIDGIAVAAGLLIFVALQFQKMTPPYFLPAFVNPQGNLSEDRPKRVLKAPASARTLIFLRITNLGITSFKDCKLEVTFPDNF